MIGASALAQHGPALTGRTTARPGPTPRSTVSFALRSGQLASLGVATKAAVDGALYVRCSGCLVDALETG
jgi:hypothetical protein